MRSMLLALVAAAVSAPALAQPAPVAAKASGVAVANSENDRIICRRGESEVGTRMQRPRVCRTKAEWRQLEEQGRRMVEKVQEGAPMRPPEPVGRPN